MYAYDDSWTDAAVRRFIRRVGEPHLALLFALRRADNAASGVGPAGEENQVELERRIAVELARSPDLLLRNRLAIDGNDLQRELGYEPGPRIGRVLDRLMERVLDDPSLNARDRCCALAREADAKAVTERTGAEPRWLTSEGTLLQSAVRATVRDRIIWIASFSLLTERRASAPMTASVRRAVRLEHRLTQPNASLADLDAAVALAVEHDLAALTVNPWLVKVAKRSAGPLARHARHRGRVPARQPDPERQGVRGLEGARAGGDPDRLRAQRRARWRPATTRRSSTTCSPSSTWPTPRWPPPASSSRPSRMTEELVRRACRLAERAGADHVVTSPGSVTARGTVARTRVLRDSVGPRIGVKACGRFRSAEQLTGRRGRRRDPRLAAAHVRHSRARRPKPPSPPASAR